MRTRRWRGRSQQLETSMRDATRARRDRASVDTRRHMSRLWFVVVRVVMMRFWMRWMEIVVAVVVVAAVLAAAR